LAAHVELEVDRLAGYAIRAVAAIIGVPEPLHVIVRHVCHPGAIFVVRVRGDIDHTHTHALEQLLKGFG
jgi:hypothetical protein